MDFTELYGQRCLFYGAHSNMFKLDSTIWEAEEDPSDGYRSYYRTTVEVAGDYEDSFSYVALGVVEVRGFDGGYDIVDVVDGYTWLEVYTDRSGDSYYPKFIFWYHPKEVVVARLRPEDRRTIRTAIEEVFNGMPDAPIGDVVQEISRVTALVAQKRAIEQQLDEENEE